MQFQYAIIGLLQLLLVIANGQENQQKKECPSPAIGSNSRIRSESQSTYQIGSKITYYCDDGYEMFGEAQRQCSDTGQWQWQSQSQSQNIEPPICARNVALGKPVNQSTTVRGGQAQNANDGDRTSIHDGRQCTETLKEVSPWWKVDLLKPFVVKLVRVTTRGCCGHQPLQDLEIRIGNSSSDLQKNPLCAWFPGTLQEGATKVLNCARPLIGQFVFLQLVGVNGSLSLCEVEVFSPDEISTDQCLPRTVSLDEHSQVSTFDRQCYEFGIARGGSFNEARNYCRSRGNGRGDLIHGSQTKQVQFLNGQLDRKRGQMKTTLVWIGVQKDAGIASRVWRWVDGRIVDNPAWGKDQPNNYNGEQNCAVLDGGRNWLWNDVGCSLDYLHWICQYEPFSCGSPDRNENTWITGNSYETGSQIRYNCPIGYKLYGGTENRTCQSNGQWTETAPQCQYIDCGRLPDPENGYVQLIDNRTSYGARAQYACLGTNYTMIGTSDAMRMCGDDGIWSGTSPKCLFNWCPEPQAIFGGSFSVSGRQVGATVAYQCESGFLLSGGDPVLTCNLGGEWTGKPPTCKYVDCGSPAPIENGNYELINGSTSFGSAIRYNCNEDFWMVGNALQICTKDAKWSHESPSCELITCEEPEIPKGGMIVGYNFNVNSKIEFRCDPGHLLIGSSSIVCNRNGQWSDKSPKCEFIDCGQVPIPANGNVTYTNQTTYLDSRVQYKCGGNYRLIGPEKRTCLESGQWSEQTNVTKCDEIRCSEPIRPERSVLSVTGNDRIYGRTSIRTAENSGDGLTYRIGAVVKYRCEKGYKVTGEPLSTCEESGLWSGQVPQCLYVDCGELDAIENGKVTMPSNATYYGATALYSCNDNFKLSGVSRRLCQDNGTWSAQVPICTEIQCELPEIDENQPIMQEMTSLQIGAILKYTCRKGWRLTGGNRTRVCTNRGEWNGKQPVCQLIDCNHPGHIENGRVVIVNGTTTFNSAIEYHCVPHYERIGGSYLRKCLETGEWSGEEPRCQKMVAESHASSGLIYSVGVGSAIVVFLLVLLLLVYMKLKKPIPVKNTENIEGIERKEDKNAAVKSYATLNLNDGQKSYFVQPQLLPNMYAAPDDHMYDTPYADDDGDDDDAETQPADDQQQPQPQPISRFYRRTAPNTNSSNNGSTTASTLSPTTSIV